MQRQQTMAALSEMTYSKFIESTKRNPAANMTDQGNQKPSGHREQCQQRSLKFRIMRSLTRMLYDSFHFLT